MIGLHDHHRAHIMRVARTVEQQCPSFIAADPPPGQRIKCSASSLAGCPTRLPIYFPRGRFMPHRTDIKVAIIKQREVNLMAHISNIGLAE
jgi:hypothetical protein